MDICSMDSDTENPSKLKSSNAPSLYTRHSFFRQTKKGKILKTVTERYIRDDLGLGSFYVDDDENRATRRVKDAVVGKPRVIETSSQLLTLLHESAPLVVCDTNILLHNLDVLEHSTDAIPNLVIPQTALLECRANQVTAYDRTVEILRAASKRRLVIFFADPHHVATAHVDQSGGESVNDVNDQRIRNVADFYASHLHGTNIRVILLTDDAGSRAKLGRDSEVEAMSMRQYVRQLETNSTGPLALSDLVAQYDNQKTGISEKPKHLYFIQHVDAVELSRGVKSGQYHRGIIRSTGASTSLVTIRRGEDRVAVTIEGLEDRNRTVDGDAVAISLHPLSKWLTTLPKSDENKSAPAGIASETAEPSQRDIDNVPDELSVDQNARLLRPTGFVVGILRRNFVSYCGSIYSKASLKSGLSTEHALICLEHEAEHADGSESCVFFPVDTMISPILIRTMQRDRLVGQRLLVAMDSWPAYSRYPLGHYVRSLGESGSKDVETEVLLLQHKIPHEPFPAKVLACLPPEEYSINAENSPGRTDLRSLPVLSIDPPGCKDIDDALHCVVLPSGNYQIGVHIADVTHYVKAGTAIDLEAANRSTSTYLVNKRLDMLPGLLTTDLCSLKGGVDRYAFSVLWEVTPQADILKVDFKKTIIHSIAALTYQQAQTLIDEPHGSDDIQAGAVKRLASLAKIFRARRIAAGALTLASPEVKFVLDSESLNPTDVQAYALLEANALVEEFMLLANVTVAKKILRHYPTLSILRRHPAPDRGMFESLISKARCRGFEIDIETSKRLADSLDAAEIETDPYFNRLLRILSTRCMSPAQYFCSGEYKPTDWHHYGLAAPVYTHFTSPIRRYADVCVHRLLAAAIDVAPLPVHLSSKSYLHDISANMNRRHRSAQLAGRASVQLHTLIFFSGDSGTKEEDAYVLDVDTDVTSDPSFKVIVPRYGIEGRVLLSHVSGTDPHLKRNSEMHQLVYESDGCMTSIQVFDKVRVRIFVKDERLVLELLSPAFGRESVEGDVESGLGSKRQSDPGGVTRSSKRKKPSYRL